MERRQGVQRILRPRSGDDHPYRLPPRRQPEAEAEVGFEVTTFVRTAAELRRTLAAKPFDVTPTDTYFVTFLKAALSPAGRAALQGLSNDFDTLVVQGRDVHWRMHGKSIDTLLTTKAWEHRRSPPQHQPEHAMLRKLSDKVETRPTS